MTMTGTGKAYAIGAEGDVALYTTYKFVTKSHKAAIAGTTSATLATVPSIRWFNNETRDYVNFRRKYYNYIDSIQGKLLLWANTIGLGMEINDLIKACNMATKELKKNPDNFLAVSLSSEKRRAILDVVELLGELNRMIMGVGEQKAKMKETERYRILLNIRMKMRELAGKIRVMAFNIYSTNFHTLWYSLLNKYEFSKCDKRNIARECAGRWIINGGGKNLRL